MHLVPVVLLVAAAGVPIACWLARNYLVFGDLTGYALNNRFKTWTPKPVSEYWHHPIFTPGGFQVFWNELIRTFWRGQMRLALHAAGRHGNRHLLYPLVNAVSLDICDRRHCQTWQQRRRDPPGRRARWTDVGTLRGDSHRDFHFLRFRHIRVELPYTPISVSSLWTVSFGVAGPVSDYVSGRIGRAAGLVAIEFRSCAAADSHREFHSHRGNVLFSAGVHKPI